MSEFRFTSTDFPHGLSHEEAAARLARDGGNELGVDQHRSPLHIALDVIREPMFLLLMLAGGIYLLLGDAHDALVLLGFVVIIMTVTMLQEQRTEKALAALRDLTSPRARVMRDGALCEIAGRELVRGDVVMLSEGDRVPADGRLLQTHELAADESLLSGESVAVDKQASNENAEQHMVLAGTLIVRGQGVLEVNATGARTQIGQIGKSLLDIVPESSPLQREVAKLTRRLALVGTVLCLILVVIYLLRGGQWMQGLLAGITLAMSVLPQEFPVIMIIFLALGARRIAQQNVLTRRLPAIQTLGETTVLCVDKTGTLTQNRMNLAGLCVGGQHLDVTALTTAQSLPEPYHELLEYAVLASEIDPHDPLEKALHRFARESLAATERLHPAWALTREYELSPELAAMSHVWLDGDGDAAPGIVATKGSPEAIADLCHLSAAETRAMQAEVERMAARGLRVLGVAKARSPASPWPDHQHAFDFTLLGLIGLADPLRPEAPAAVQAARVAGIRVMMITGDHPGTARNIAAAAGIDGDHLVTGAKFAAMSAAQRAQAVREVNVFARITPQQKLLIVEALKANREVVAMTGDGVNDAPALKAAHIGIAMGKRGTDVAREAASLVLLDDDFTAIISAIRLGRRIYANLRQALIYTLAVHVPIIGLSLLPVLFGLPLLLAPAHIAFLELLIDPTCSLVFETEPEAPGLMQQPPRSVGERVIALPHLVLALLQGLCATGVVMALYLWTLHLTADGADNAVARTAAFIALIAADAVLILASRSRRATLGRWFANFSRTGTVVFVATLASLVLITTVPPLAALFAFAPLSPAQWLASFATGASCLLLFEATKLLVPLRQRR